MVVAVSKSFKKMTVRAILSIFLFVIVYITLILLAIGLTFLCALGSYYLIKAKPTFYTLMIGVGLVSLGVFILAFLFKFLFKKHTVDRSHLIEITKENEPKLFQFINEIVEEVGTTFPKKIYLSSDVNASVFYDSSFWSLFFPVKKNLQIGVGLVNAISKQELKGILAHEFGHFSQKSMKVGSYVYYVNQIIFNMLYENDSFDTSIQNWGNSSGYISFFLSIAVAIIRGIQWILKKMYSLINISYLALSREMEFHADEVAANVAGSKSLQDSLLRMDLVDSAYNSVISFYNDKLSANFKSQNIYKEHSFVLNHIANDNQLQFKNALPVVTDLEINKFNKSKLNIENQWASHPSTLDRNTKLEKLKIHKEYAEDDLANSVFQDFEKTQEKLTSHIFSSIENVDSFAFFSFENFKNEFLVQFKNNSFDSIYNGYYDNKNPIYFDVESVEKPSVISLFETLFSKEKVDSVYELIGLENDINSLNAIANKELKVKTFDYDGHKFKANEASEIIPKLENEIAQLRNTIANNDIAIFQYFNNMEKKVANDEILILKYKAFFEYDKEYEKRLNYYNDLINSTSFVAVVTPFEEIKSNFKKVYQLEHEFKNEIKEMLSNKLYQKEITPTIKDNFELYLKEDWVYFANNKYIDEELNILYSALNNYIFLLSRGYFLIKKELLDYQCELLAITTNSIEVKVNEFQS